MSPEERALGAVAGAFGAFVVSLMTAKNGEDYKHPRLATVTLLALVGVCFWAAREHGPGTWIGLFFAVLVPVNAWLALRAGVEAWADCKAHASLGAARERAAERRRQRDAVDRALGNGGHS